MVIVSATGSTSHLHRVDVLQKGCIFSLILQLLRSIYVSSCIEHPEGDADLCDSTYNLEASRDMPCNIQTHWLSSHGMIELACSAPCKEHLDLHASTLQTYRYDE